MELANKSNSLVYYCLKPFNDFAPPTFLEGVQFDRLRIEHLVGKEILRKQFSLRLSFKSQAYIFCVIFNSIVMQFVLFNLLKGFHIYRVFTELRVKVNAFFW